jgi:hypothetical protein
MGGCPCPRCKIAKSIIENVGSKPDMKIRKDEVRLDDEDRRHKVEAARKLIYKEGLALNSERVEALLKPESLVPTQV